MCCLLLTYVSLTQTEPKIDSRQTPIWKNTSVLVCTQQKIAFLTVFYYYFFIVSNQKILKLRNIFYASDTYCLALKKLYPLN